jgi:hypothetical protein
MSLLRSEVIVKVSKEGEIKLEVDVFSLLLTVEDTRRLMKKLEYALFEEREVRDKKKVNGG